MINTLLKITKLSLSAFRGIPEKIELDLSSPLTIIYAPNGTGKTSCIDAAEWLLTNEIKRLSQLTGKSEDPDLRCKFATDNTPTEVLAQVIQGGKKFQLSKTLEQWILTNGDAKFKTPKAILKALAPNAVDETTDHEAAPKMQKIWLRGTRFLTESDLSTLIDTNLDKNKKEPRRQILSDLMGVTEIDDRAKEFENFSGYLKTGYKGEKGITAIEKELMDKERLLEKKVTSERRSSEDGTMDTFKVAVRELGLACSSITGETLTRDEIKDYTSLEAFKADLSAKFEIKQKHLKGLKKAMEFIEIHWPEKDTILSTPETLETTERTKKELFNKTKINIEKQRNEQDSLNKLLIQKKQETELLSKANVTIKEVIFTFSSQPKNLPKKLHELLQAYADIPEDSAKRAALLKIVENVEAEFPGVIRISKEVYDLEKKLQEHENKLEENDPQKIRCTLEVARGEARKAESKYLSASGPLEQLKLTTKKVMEVLNNTTACPVCAHDWGTNDELKTALAFTVNQVSPLLVELKNEESEKKQIVLQLESDLRKAEELMSLRSQSAKNKELIEGFYQSISPLKSFFGKSPLDVPKDFEAFLRAFPKRLSAGAQIYELRDTISPLKKFIQNEEEDFSLEQLSALIEEVKEDLENEERGKATEISMLDESIKTKQNELKSLDSESESIRTKLLAARSLKNNFLENWNKISEHPTANEENFGLCKALIKEKEDTLTKSESHLSAASSLVNDISRGNEISTLREEIDKIKKRLRLLKSTKETADDAVRIFKERSKNYCREQMEKLSNVMFSIFGRIQANEIFDNIKGGAKDDPFEWIAMATGYEFTPSKHFSMGQRQDLALSIFLARARGLGGTFFLDEPIIHLDDLNRVALLDMLRVLVVEKSSNINLVVTTASRALVRHLQEKFCNLPCKDNILPMRVLELQGTPRTEVTVTAH